MGVGSKYLGQWEEWSGRAYHIRRRLSPSEQDVVGAVRDIRDTPEERTRLAVILPYMPAWLQAQVAERMREERGR